MMACNRRFSFLYREGNSKEIRTAIETLLRIHRNIRDNPNDNKYKKIRINNPAFQSKVWHFKGAQMLMHDSGWRQENMNMVFYGDATLDYTIDQLLENRLISPLETEWVDDNKFEGISEAQLREDELRRKAVEERDKELIEFMKDKKEREVIAKNIKEEHEADRQRRRFLHPEKSNKLKKGAKICTLHTCHNKDHYK